MNPNSLKGSKNMIIQFVGGQKVYFMVYSAGNVTAISIVEVELITYFVFLFVI